MAATEAAPKSAARPRPDVLIERERRERPRAGIAAVLAALLGLAAWILPQGIYHDYPRVTLISALQDAAGPRAGEPGLATPRLLFLHDKATALLGIAILQSLAVLALGWLIVTLYRAAHGRGSTVPKISHLLAMFGAVAATVGAIGMQVAVMVKLSDFAGSSDHTTQAAHDALRSNAISGMQAVGQIGVLALAAAVVLVALGAMRVGLLTRFLGVLGVIVGALMVLFGPAGLGAPPFLVQAFWLFMVGLLLIGRMPGGLPPAWRSGEAVPWPTQQELMEARQQRSAAARGGDVAATTPEGAAATLPSAATSKRKRKRRR
jgi:hypothetical protein